VRDELKVTEQRALQLILDSLSAAQSCAEMVNRESDNIPEANLRAKISLAFTRACNPSLPLVVQIIFGFFGALALAQARVSITSRPTNASKSLSQASVFC
jgi:hypothetical protein